MNRPGTIDSSYIHNAAGRLLTLLHVNTSNRDIIAQFDYTLAARGNRSQTVERWLPAGSSTLQNQTIRYGYDSLSRVQSATYYPEVLNSGQTPTTSASRTYTYDYDRAGNRTRENVMTLAGIASTYTYNNANQLVNEITGSTSYSYLYDNNGNLRERRQEGTLLVRYAWNRANRLSSIGSTVNYLYDGDGNRVSMAVSGQPTTTYIHDIASALPTILTATQDAAITRYMHGGMGIHAEWTCFCSRLMF